MRYAPLVAAAPDVSRTCAVNFVRSVPVKSVTYADPIPSPSAATIVVTVLGKGVLKVISAFTVNLSYNLEPIYSIIGAMLIFQEAKDLNFSFYLGLGLIVLSVVLQTLNVLSQHHKFIPSLYVKWKR